MPKAKKRKKQEETKPSERSLHRELTTQMLQLITSGFGVVAALAWNDAIQTFVKEYIEQIFPRSGLISKFIYAALITTLIVLITYQLSTIAARFRPKN
jgi:hypothetical protein